MTRAVVFLTAALAAASLGLFAENSSTNPATPASTSAQVQSQGTAGNSVPQTNAPSSSNPATAASPNASAQNAPATQAASPATSNNKHTIEHSGSASNTAAEDESANSQLPQTSTILPLLGLIGLGSLVAGLFARR